MAARPDAIKAAKSMRKASQDTQAPTPNPHPGRPTDPNGKLSDVLVEDVVLIVNFVVATVPFRERPEGDHVHVAPLGRLGQLSKTTPLKPFEGVTVTV